MTKVLNRRQLAYSFICSLARLTSLPTRKWSEDFRARIRKDTERDDEYQQAWKQVEETPEEWGTIEIQVRLLLRKRKLWILRLTTQPIIESEHDTKVAGHIDQNKTIELIQWNFWWPKMNNWIINFVGSCPKCQQNKISHHQPYGLFSPLELPYVPW